MFENRSMCGTLSQEDINKKVYIYGWVNSIRNLGGITFIQIRDISGLIQVVIDSDKPELKDSADTIKSEYVVEVTGKIQNRSEDAINKDLPTGYIEVIAESITTYSQSEVPPFQIDSREQPGEEIRLNYRFLDLRREDMKEAIIKRHIALQTIRKNLVQNKFFEIETPILNKSTPEGARDFLVPSRVNRGKFYALPQSPQLFKQILMVAGYERYFQVVKCFRDEDLRHDRQPEFTQVDLELSFVTADMVMEVIEGLLIEIVKDVKNIDVNTPFIKLTYDEAMERFGSDAPDTRFDLELKFCNDIFNETEFGVFKGALDSSGVIKGIAVPDNGKFSRKIIDSYTEFVKNTELKDFLS